MRHGGHLTHGSPVNFSGLLFKVVSYGLDPETNRLNYDLIRKQAQQHRPKLIIAGYSAYPRLLDFAAFRQIADEVGATLVVDMAHFAGLVAGKVYPTPFGHADVITSTTHKTLRGPRGGIIFCRPEFAKAIDKSVFPGMQGGPQTSTGSRLTSGTRPFPQDDATSLRPTWKGRHRCGCSYRKKPKGSFPDLALEAAAPCNITSLRLA